MTKTKSISKHIAIILAVFTTIVLLSSCSSTPTPTETAETFLNAIKSQDKEAMDSIYKDSDLDLLDAASESAGENGEAEETNSGLDKVYEEQLMPKMLDYDFEISNEQINEDKATVDVKITTYRIGNAFSAFFGEYISQAFMLAFSNTSEEELDALATTMLSGKLADLTEKTYEKTATMSLTKEDDKWVIDSLDDNTEMLDAITGGLVSSMMNMSDAFTSWEEEE